MNSHVNFELRESWIRRIKILSVGTYLPEQVVTSDDLFESIRSDMQYGLPFNWMSRHLGIIERRMADEHCIPSDLAIPAAKAAISDCEGLDPDDIDMIIFCGIERDQPEPATAHTIQHSLGLHAKHALDISNACFGFVHGMEVASNFIKTGSVRKALVVTGEVPTKVLKKVVDVLRKGVELEQAKLLIGALSVGDAGGAVILGSADDDSGFETFNHISESEHVNKCIYRIGENGIPEGQMQMGPITGAVYELHERIIDGTLKKLDWPEFDWVLLHQTGMRPFEQFANLNGVNREKMIKTFHKFGNITSATFPVNFEILKNNDKVAPGDRVGGCFAGSGLSIGQFGYTY